MERPAWTRNAQPGATLILRLRAPHLNATPRCFHTNDPRYGSLLKGQPSIGRYEVNAGERASLEVRL